ncbi:MAG: hypothetical protein JSV78_11245 [Phycisphaerales bacterium]|nr:MAG: hypothetical protein JSV78_11245 [Phycisphaerales bacterium]
MRFSHLQRPIILPKTLQSIQVLFPRRGPRTRGERTGSTSGYRRALPVKLGLSIKTVEAHRAHMMQKLGARTTADLVRTVLPVLSLPESPNSSSRPD